MDVVSEFRGPYGFLSNFWPCELVFEGLSFPSVEHAFAAAKSPDPRERRLFLHCSAVDAKRIGRRVTLRPEWETLRIVVMQELLALKFARGGELAEWLERTGDARLVEGNHWGDVFWGVCRGRGLNKLGELLMERRTLNRAGCA